MIRSRKTPSRNPQIRSQIRNKTGIKPSKEWEGGIQGWLFGGKFYKTLEEIIDELRKEGIMIKK